MVLEQLLTAFDHAGRSSKNGSTLDLVCFGQYSPRNVCASSKLNSRLNRKAASAFSSCHGIDCALPFFRLWGFASALAHLVNSRIIIATGASLKFRKNAY